jgi:hypothetical protein
LERGRVFFRTRRLPEKGERIMRSAFCYALAVAVSAWIASSARAAAFTSYNSPPPGEGSQPGILETVYGGGTFVPTSPGSKNFTNGAITAVRVEDTYNPAVDGLTPPSPLSTTENIGNDDRLWSGNFHLASAEAIFGVYRQEFGYYNGASGGTYHKLFDQTGYGYDVQGSADLDPLNLSNTTIRWARGGENRVLSSNPSDNQDGLDHLITYRIDGLGDGQLTWLLFWEDKLSWEQNADFDYDDEVVQIKAYHSAQPLPAVPEPGTIALLLLTPVALLRRAGRA